jgi:hypothetical protein
MVESTKEFTSKSVQDIPNIRIGKILRIAVQEATFGWLCFDEMQDNRRQHDGILKRHVKPEPERLSFAEHAGGQRDYLRRVKYPVRRSRIRSLSTLSISRVVSSAKSSEAVL